MSVLGVIFDFDDTLLPDSTSTLLAANGVGPQEFWPIQVKKLLDEGYDPPVAPRPESGEGDRGAPTATTGEAAAECQIAERTPHPDSKTRTYVHNEVARVRRIRKLQSPSGSQVLRLSGPLADS